MADKNEEGLNENEKCAHSFCIVERQKKKKGFAPPKPKGLPWGTGLLRALPGNQPLCSRSQKNNASNWPKKKQKFCKNALFPIEDRRDIRDQIKFYMRVVSLANDLKDGKYAEETGESQNEKIEEKKEEAKETTEPAPAGDAPAPAEPPPPDAEPAETSEN